jgi:hypothetical protein
LLVALCALCVVGPGVSRTLYAQAADGIDTDPIRCWWKTDRPAVSIGQRFTVALTCGVIDTAAVTVVPTLTQLEPGAVQLTPFEVVGGARGEDIVSPPWRYFQYQYTLRLIGDGFFGRDVAIPPVTVTYNIKAAAGGGSQGRDQGYVLPAMAMRIESLVPGDASDIRDVSDGAFADVDQRRFRATAAFVGAGLLFGFAAVLLVLALARLVQRTRQGRPSAAPSVSATMVLGGCLRALRAVKADAGRTGWSAAHARRALAALRVAGAVALGRPIGHVIVDRHAAEREGQLAVRSGWLRPRRAMVSAPTTAPRVTRELGNGHVHAGAARVSLQELGDALGAFNAAGYGRSGELDALALDGAIDAAERAVRRLRIRRLLPIKA